MSEPTKHPNRELIDGMRACCDWMEENPIDTCSDVMLNVFPGDLARAIKGMGHLEKETKGDHYFSLVKRFGPRVSVEWNKKREEVCERVLVGIEIIPAKPARTVELPEEPEKVEELYVWKCPESILAALKPEAAQPEPLPTEPATPFNLTLEQLDQLPF